jgi:lambda family phage portal protein
MPGLLKRLRSVLPGGGGREIVALGGGLEGADRTSRETATWWTDRRSPDQIINQAKMEADARGRDMVSNDGYAQGIIDINRDNIVGSQYRLNAIPNWQTLSEIASASFDQTWADEFQEAVEERFNLVADSNECWLDASRQLTFTGMVRMAVAGFVYTGEVLSTAEWIRETDRPFSTAIQMISPMRLSNPNDQADDATLRRGVRKDDRGKPLGYYIRVGYPFESYPSSIADSFSWNYVLATKPWGRRMVLHIVDPFQPSQTRGLSAMVAVLKQMRMTKRFQEITLQNAVINASYAATIESELPSSVIGAAMGTVPQTDMQGAFMGFVGDWLTALQSYLSQANTVAIDGAKIPHLFPGTKLNTQALGTPGGVGTEFETSLLRHIAAGLGISYEEFAADWSKVNYSSGRASMLKTWKHMAARKKFVADRFADEVYTLWLEEALNAGELPLPRGWNSRAFYLPYGKEAFSECDWIGAARGQIDELKETQASLLRIKGGLSTREIEIAKQGGDWRKVFRQLAREEKLRSDLGLESFDSNPQRDGSTSGQTVMQENTDSGGTDSNAISLDDLTEAMESAMVSAITGMPQPPAPPEPPDLVKLFDTLPKPVEPVVNVNVHLPGKGIERTRVTKHDAQGRILEFEREEVAPNA